jgi:multiple sugar transport system permease protein
MAAIERTRRAVERREKIVGALLVLPALVGLGVFVIWPMLDAVVLSFFDRRLTSRDAPFEGLGNWESIFADPAFISSLGFTALYALSTVAVSVLLALSLSLALIDRPALRRVVAPLVLLPTATALIVASIGWRFVFDLRGVLNRLLELVGIERVNWLNEEWTARFVLIFVGVWSMTGFALLLYQAALGAIPGHVFEAARVFGRWRGIRNKLTLISPLVSRTTIVAIVVSTIVTLRAFDQILALTGGGPTGATENIAYLAWQRSFRFYDLGEGSAASVVLVVLVLVITGVELLVLRRLAAKGSYA